MPELKFKFDRHGLGDVCHMAHAVQIYKRHGYDVTVQAEENKLFLWKVAGVNIVQGGDLPDHSYHYPSGFDDLTQPDHATNKVAFGLRHDVMPKLEDLGLTQEQLWDELCAARLSAHDHIPPEAHAEAEQFLEGLPRPIICFHSRGTNWHERKSLPTEVAFDVILKLLDQTGGSVVVLDYDRRAPMVGDARCKGIKPSWGHIGIDRLCALYERSDLMIGVDSGPLHVASLTNIKTLGVFRSLHPNRVCLPNPNAVYLVNQERVQQLASRQDRWRLAKYMGVEPTGEDIALMAIKILKTGTEIERSKESIAMQQEKLAGVYTYQRVGYDERQIELLPEGTIGRGAGDCERKWFSSHKNGDDRIFISGRYGVICECNRDNDGIFRGRWTQFERIPIELRRADHNEDGSPLTSPGRIRLVMNWDDVFDDIAAITTPNRHQYASRHGYQIAESRFAGAWGKIEALLQNWDKAEWLFWLDSDAMITKLDQKLEGFLEDGIDVVVTHDRNGLATGSMIVRTTPVTKAIFEDLLKRRNEFDVPDGCYEQTGLSRLLWKISHRVRVLPKRRIDPYPARCFPEISPDEGWHAGDFAIHVPALPLAKRREILRETLQCVN